MSTIPENVNPGIVYLDPKYHVVITQHNGQLQLRLVQTSSGLPVPFDEPLMLFRSRDTLAVDMLIGYLQLCIKADCDEAHIGGVMERIQVFNRFRREHPKRMKKPGTTPGGQEP